ncbi:hypothetical protein P3H15_42220 [Rhodococcus sp. T2V]|uniref:hypothetical protein n=1 Tax=Rhodococcus sp. T2V TaxID=3034164 RepID=UPI0023E229DA|nr:hypothetical protein [Rhodococcus sp. T2V]MDF3311598.1 hypothetical protein [Rhodococcus sp. T2V]
MAVMEADFEFGLVWDEIQKSFDVSLRFTKNGVDRSRYPRSAPVTVDIAALRRLRSDEEYSRLLTRSVFEHDSVRAFYQECMASAGALPIHFRLNVDGPTEYHAVRWELLGAR